MTQHSTSGYIYQITEHQDPEEIFANHIQSNIIHNS